MRGRKRQGLRLAVDRIAKKVNKELKVAKRSEVALNAA
jgi:hypothetical protein